MAGLFILWMFSSWAASAEVERLEVTSRRPVAEGRAFAGLGAYEELRGKLHFAVDPEHPTNQPLVDIRYGRRGADGKLRFHSDFILIQPRNPKGRRGTLLMEVPNRGRRSLARRFHGVSHPPDDASWSREALLLERGLSLLWVGWQADTPYDPERLSLQKVEAEVDAQGLMRSDHVFSEPAKVMPLAHRNHRPYGVSRPEDPRNRLTVRASAHGPRQLIPRQRWRFGRIDGDGKVVPDPFWVHLEGGFEAGKIYEVVYVAEKPWLAALGLAALRDAASYFKHAKDRGADDGGRAGAAAKPRTVVVFGASQAGRLLRQMIYQGLTRDPEGRQVFDGIWIHAAGAGRGSFNHRFAEPSRDAHAFSSFDYPVDLPPFAGVAAEGAGLYDRWRQPVPAGDAGLPAKIFITHTSYEYWSRGASLTHAATDGGSDLPLHGDERIYFLSGSQHVLDGFPPRNLGTRYPNNPMDTRCLLRGLWVALEDWVVEGRTPPPSRYPKIADGTLVLPERVRWPEVKGIHWPTASYRPRRLDFGRRFEGHGIIDRQPPEAKGAFVTGVPQVDADGNEIAGIRLPMLTVPVATYTGWNFRSRKIGAPHELALTRGAILPFTFSRGAHDGGGDARVAVETRYGSRQDYLDRVRAATASLVRQRFLLAADEPALRRRAVALWDAVEGRQIKAVD